ncbi:hypothetical protein [Bacillus sp. 03113]|uniref:hypothetical protein n=1 Tax=Bacillus sp. 03113 TaxID=2578211 RepID=UPI0011413472|nr:hypothetical protein [Bacillus sp. 03113]
MKTPEQEKQNADKEDRLSLLMFGHRDDKVNENYNEKKNLFDLFFEGDKPEREHDNWLFRFEKTKHSENESNHLQTLIKNVDIDDLFNHIDTLMSSASKLKPLIHKVSPFLKQTFTKE